MRGARWDDGFGEDACRGGDTPRFEISLVMTIQFERVFETQRISQRFGWVTTPGSIRTDIRVGMSRCEWGISPCFICDRAPSQRPGPQTCHALM